MVRKRNEEMDEKIYELREKRMSYKAISDYFISQGENIGINKVMSRCKVIYRIKGKKEPTTKYRTKLNEVVKNEDLYLLIESGLSYEEIANYYEKNGIKVSVDTIRRRCETVYRLKDKEFPKEKRNNEDLKDAILNLRKTKGATSEQINQIAALYGINLQTKEEADADNKNNSEKEEH